MYNDVIELFGAAHFNKYNDFHFPLHVHVVLPGHHCTFMLLNHTTIHFLTLQRECDRTI